MTHLDLRTILEVSKQYPWQYQLPSSYVSANYRYFYQGIGKAASSQIKRCLHLLEEYTLSGKRWNNLHRRADADQRYVPSLLDFEMDVALDVLTSSSWFRFCFVRNPYQRLYSAYKDKILTVDIGDYYRQVQADIRTMHDSPQFIDFHHFVAYVEQTIAYQPDPHWVSFVEGLLPKQIAYDFVGRVETFTQDFTQVLKRLGAHADILSLVPERRNVTPQQPLTNIYDAALASAFTHFIKPTLKRTGTKKKVGVLSNCR